MLFSTDVFGCDLVHGPCVSQPRGIYMQIQGYPLPALDSLCPVFPHFLGSLVLLSSGLDSSAFLDSHFFISVPACLVYWRVPPGQKFIMHISHPLLPCFKCHILSSFSPLLIVFKCLQAAVSTFCPERNYSQEKA